VRTRRTWTSAATATVVTVLTFAVPPAAAEPDDRPGVPSRSQVEAARERVDRTARDVAAIKAELAMANARLEAAAVEAERAAEAYNGARWELQQATDALADARADARRARRAVAEQRDLIGSLVAASYQQASQLTGLNAMMGADGPEGVLDQYVAFQGATTSVRADYARFAATDSVAQVFERKAERARSTQLRVAQQARAARADAAAAADDAQAAAATVGAEKDRLIVELARAQDISVALARQRQTALEEIARRRAAAAAAAKAEAAAAAAARAERRQRAERARTTQPTQPAVRPRSKPDPQPTPEHKAPPPTPAPSGGVSAVIEFARQQVGEPYVWGAAGPDAWDCSGLTMRAWEQAGISLPHYSVAQYDAGTPISAGQLQRGDLVFWSSSGSPSGIHHVALYIGDGMIVHAPRTGRPVAVESMYYWVPPTHFVRL
jgi:cell wall-associated NlpC family hydrolase